MKSFKLCFIACSFIFINSISAQFFSIEDIETGRLSSLKPANKENLQWGSRDDIIYYSNNDTLFSFDIDEKTTNVVLTRKTLNEVLETNGAKKLLEMPQISFLSSDICFFRNSAKGFYYSIINRDIKDFPLPLKAESILTNKKKQSLAYLLDNNIYFVDSDGSTYPVTNDSLEGIDNGDLVYRKEFGIVQGMYWSPRGNYLAYYRRDQTGVEKYPLVDIDNPRASLVPDPYPMVDENMENTSVRIYSTLDQSVLELNISEAAGVYHTNLSWTPDEKTIYLQHLNRGQDTLILLSYSAETGQPFAELFTETHQKYVEPMFPVVFLKQTPGDFLYLSERDGYRHLYLYNGVDGTLKQLTQGEWEITELLGLDTLEQYIYFMGTKESCLERHLYKLDRTTQEIKLLTYGEGTHEVTFSHDMSYFIDEYSSFSTPRKINVCNSEDEIIKELLVAENPIKSFELGEIEIGKLKAADGKTDLYYKLTKPIGFDSTRKYPVIIYVYGGPHVQLIDNSWMDRIDFLHQYYAQQGFVSFMVDCRGSDYRGRDFEDIIHRQLGIPQLEDQMEGVNFLKSFSWVDTNRIGVNGWSFGGYMTINLMLNFPDVFKVGIAGGPVTDWRYYEVMYGERYMDTPEQNQDGYTKTNINTQVEKLNGKLLVIHGAMDDVVVWQNSLQFIQSCIEQGKQVDYFVYPLHKHNVIGKDRVHLTRMMTGYFKEHL